MSTALVPLSSTEITTMEGLTKIQKLAALLVMLGPEESSVILSSFHQRQVEQIMSEMAKIEMVSSEVQQGLMREFSALTLDAVTSAVGGLEKAQHVLERSLGPIKAREMIGRVAPNTTSSPHLEELKNTPAKGILQMLRGEHPQTWALILAQLEAPNSAEIFKTMDPVFRADVMRRMAKIEPISPEVLDRLIKGILARRPQNGSIDYVGSDGTQFLTDIMKRFDRSVATEALEALSKKDPELSASIRKRMFVFDDLVNLDAPTISVILREVDFNTLAIALKESTPQLSELIFKSITKRAAETLEENMKFMTKVRKKEIDEAKEKVMGTVFDLERKGEISLSRDE